MNDFTIPSDYLEIKTIEGIQTLLYKLLFEFHRICEENGLFYNAFGGTLLGAVRHGGIIPWDDDVDVGMPRNDYEHFIELISSGRYEDYEIFLYPRKNYVYPFAKFCLKDSILIEKSLLPQYSKIKLYIDVFPIDGYPVGNEETYFKEYTACKVGVCECVYPVGISPVFIRKFAYPFKCIRAARYRTKGVEYYIKRQMELAKSYSYDQSEIILCMGAGWNEKGKLNKSIYENRKLFPFGKGVIWGLADYDEHLTNLYGDYMTPPPEDKRVSNHNYSLYVKDSLWSKANE